MAQTRGSLKHNLIDKANSTIVAVTAGACFVTIFSLVASIALVSQLQYQNRIIDAKKEAVSQLKEDIDAVDSLVDSYKAFVGSTQNVIGGNPSGTGSQDGDNAKIVLDALPSKYDFPALATSLEKLLTSQNVQIQSISGTDDEVAQSQSQSSSAPAPVPIPFQVTVSGDYKSIRNVIDTFEHSIRPFQIQIMDVSGDQKNLTMSLTAQTYYQPEKNLNIQKKVIK